MMHFFNRFRIRPVDRLVIMLYVTDTLYFWNTSRSAVLPSALRCTDSRHEVPQAIFTHFLGQPVNPRAVVTPFLG